ncbi:MAG: rhamnogalacturonan lyase [Chitinispirillaceae bacterium]|nr:rhamnogalacturonan lyase [Chitinispirillaceae bacterium]
MMCCMLRIAVVFFAVVSTALGAFAQRCVERLNRGLVAVSAGGGYFLSWRQFGTEPLGDTFGFNIYKGTTKLNSSTLTSATCYQDNSGGGGTYTVRPATRGVEGAVSEAARVLSQNYLSVPLQVPAGGTTPDGVAYTYGANDCSVGDLDGDGEYEIIVKWDPSNSKDNSQTGYAGNAILDAYQLNGTRLWRINLGRNIRAGAHYTQFMVYDLDGDGKAEVACKTADGTVDGTGTVIGSSSADYRVTSSSSPSYGFIISGPEYLTIFSGQTGKALVTTDYVPLRGSISGWGGVGGNAGNDSYGNRVDRFNACIAYLDGVRPSLVMCRGIYGRSVLVAWDWRGGQLTRRWIFDSSLEPWNSERYSGMGNHGLSVADVDADGRDEIVYGAMCVDDNGQGLYSTQLRHGDAMHCADINPSRPGLEVWGVHEVETVVSGYPNLGAALFDARTGEVLWSASPQTDVGRGVAADLTSAPGMECWGGTSGLRTCTNGSAGSAPASSNFLCWWDGDLFREIEDGISVTKYGGGTLLTASGCASNNGTKATPCLVADIWGDWREEIIWRTSDNTALRIYTTTTATATRIYTLMHDPQYRLAAAWQNVAYNQPPHPGFFLGNNMTLPPPKPDITYYSSTAIIERTVPAALRIMGNGAMKILSGMTLVFPESDAGTRRVINVYTLNGMLVRRCVFQNNAVNLERDLGLADGIYLVRCKPFCR